MEPTRPHAGNRHLDSNRHRHTTRRTLRPTLDLFRRRPPSAAHPGQHRARRIWLGGKETKLGRDREIALDRDTTALLIAYRDHCRQQAAAHDTELASNGFIFTSVPDGSVCLAPASLGQRFHRLVASLGIQTTRPARRLESWIGALATSTNGSGRRRPTERKACPIVTDLAAFAELVPLDHGLCVVSTLRGDGGVQSSVVNAGVLEHPLRTGQVVGLVATLPQAAQPACRPPSHDRGPCGLAMGNRRGRRRDHRP
jgi:hypothetical protein